MQYTYRYLIFYMYTDYQASNPLNLNLLNKLSLPYPLPTANQSDNLVTFVHINLQTE